MKTSHDESQAEKIMLESEENKEYLPIQGLEAFNKATAELLLGQDHPAIKVVLELLLLFDLPLQGQYL